LLCFESYKSTGICCFWLQKVKGDYLMRRIRGKKRSYKRIALLGILFMLVTAGAAYCYFGGGLLQSQKTVADGMMTANDKTNIMIMGIDRREDDVGRSDTLMVATLDSAKEEASLLSIPRDTRVKIRDNGYDKINHAYAFGGHTFTQESVENLLGVPIDYYVLIDIHAFERIIDAIGGVDINVEKRMHYEDPWDDDGGLVIDLYPGEQHMDGKKAIQYVRYRDGEGDIGRIARQQHFMKAVLDRIMSPKILPKLPQIIREISSAVETNMTFKDMMRFAGLLKKVKDNGIVTNMVPGKPAYLKDISYWIPDIQALRKLVAKQMGVEMDEKFEMAVESAAKEYEEAAPKGLTVVEDAAKKEKTEKEKTAKTASDITVLVINSSGITGAGAEVADILRHKGFKISSVETGRASSRPQTTIMAAAAETNIFYGMPFKCTIMPGGEGGQAVVNIGLDYKK